MSSEVKGIAPMTAHGPWRQATLVALLVLGASFGGCASGNGHRDAAGTVSTKTHTISFPIVHETHEDIVADVEACREGVAMATWLPESSRQDLNEVCDKGLHRGLTEVRQYGEQVCSEVAFTMSPSASAVEKARVLEACESKTKKFGP